MCLFYHSNTCTFRSVPYHHHPNQSIPPTNKCIHHNPTHTHHSGAYGIEWRQALVLSYSGLRGAVGLTLAIAIHQDEGIRHATRDR